MIKDGRFLKSSIVVRFVFVALSLAGVDMAQAQLKNCVSASEMSVIAKDFPQFRNLANGSDYCLDGSQTANLIEGLMFMRKTRFEGIMPQSRDELFSGKFAQDWYGYFIGRIHDFDVQQDCPKGVGAYVYSFGNTMYVCPMLLTANFTSMDRASVFMHEARHIDGFPHVTCRRGPRQGLQGACDTRISAGGSYAVSVETYAQLGRYAPDLHPALRAYAKSSAVIYADEAFDTPVNIDRSPRFLILTQDRRFHRLDLAQAGGVQDLGLAPELGRLVPRGQHLILFPDNKNSQARYVFTRGEGELAQQAGDLAVEYNQMSAAQKSQFVDAHIGAQWVAQIFKDRVKFACDPRGSSTRELSLNGEVASSLLYPNGYDRGMGVIQLQTESGRIFDLSCNRGTPSIVASSLSLDRRFRKLYRSGNDVIGLGMDASLYRVQNGVSSLLVTGYEGQVYELTPAQSFDFFETSLIN